MFPRCRVTLPGNNAVHALKSMVLHAHFHGWLRPFPEVRASPHNTDGFGTISTEFMQGTTKTGNVKNPETMKTGTMKKYLITDHKFASIDMEREIIQAAGGELAVFQCKTEDDVIQAAQNAEALLVQWAPITRAVIEKLPRCRVIVRYGIGIDNIDLDAARSRGIVVCNVPSYCIDEVADHTFSLGLALSRQLSTIDRRVRQGTWAGMPPKTMLASRQMIFATIGYGRIARAVLDRARGFKFSLAACDPYLPAGATLPADTKLLTLEQALQTADILSLHLPLSESTHHLLNAEAFAKMKPTALLVNTARGGLIDTVALAEALSTDQIAGAGIDVFEQEPLSADHPLRKCENALLTSHVAWYSELSMPELQKQAAEEAVRVMSGDTPQSRVA